MQFTGKEFLRKDFQVSSFHTDFKGLLSLPSLFSLFQEMAWEHATLNRFGYEHLLEQGFFWALSRIKVEIIRLPNWTENFSITTWPSGVESAFALRDFQLRSAKNEIMIGATTSWLIVDIKTRRPQRPDTFKERMPICDSIRATKENAQRVLVPNDEIDSSYDVISAISDIDVNGHINNAKYIEWAVNAFTIEEYKSLKMNGISVNFLSEGFCGDSCTVKMVKQVDSHYSAVISRKGDGKDLAVVSFMGIT